MEESLLVDRSLLVVIPAFNEEAVLGRTLDALLQEVPSNQVLVVSDGSTDKTSQIVLDKDINLLELSFNLGVGAAMRAGFQYAKENGFQKVIQFDADLQHQPKYIREIVSKLDELEVNYRCTYEELSNRDYSIIKSVLIDNSTTLKKYIEMSEEDIDPIIAPKVSAMLIAPIRKDASLFFKIALIILWISSFIVPLILFFNLDFKWYFEKF